MSFTETLKNLFIPHKTQREIAQPDYGNDMRAVENWVSGDLVGFLESLVAYVNGITPGTGYASLTGPGETTTPGALTQAGPFTVNAPTGNISFNTTVGAFSIQSNGNVFIQTNGNVVIEPGGSFNVVASNAAELVFNGDLDTTLGSSLPGNILLSASSVVVIDGGTSATLEGADVSVTANATSGTVSIDGHTTTILSPNVNVGDTASASTVAVAPGSGSKIGFYQATPIVQPTVTGSRSGNVALANLITELHDLGLILDSTTP